jgi:hypothetical protein
VTDGRFHFKGDHLRQFHQIALGDLIDLFDREAKKMCRCENEARHLASQALQDFINTYGKDVIIE